MSAKLAVYLLFTLYKQSYQNQPLPIAAMIISSPITSAIRL
ncbi:Uncharacterised protein [Parabacteroides merdae]|nr:Uncharacterised protein [Parabacteroides merdae]